MTLEIALHRDLVSTLSAVPLYTYGTKQKQTPVSPCSPLCLTDINSIFIWVSFRGKEKTKPVLIVWSSAICPVDGFFILSTHILESWFVNTDNQPSHQLPLWFQQQADILGLGNLVHVLISLLKLTLFCQTIMNLMFQI